MEILVNSDNPKVHAHSSIDQYSKFIATYERGGWTPIEFDYIDYISCDHVVSHPIIIEFDDKIGYNFPEGEYEYSTDLYQKFDYAGTELRELNECLGEGFYEAYDSGEEIINFDNSALGTRNNIRLRIGKDYYLADEFLEAEE